MSRAHYVTIPDRHRSAWLGDVGAARWNAAVCVDSNGVESLWLLGPCGDCESGCACSECAPHEQLGAKLPYKYRERLGVLQRCGAPTASGRPCRQLVRPGTRCGHHAGRQP